MTNFRVYKPPQIITYLHLSTCVSNYLKTIWLKSFFSFDLNIKTYDNYGI